MKIVLASLAALVAVIVIVLVISSQKKSTIETVTTTPNTPLVSSTTSESGYHFVSVAEGFEMDFPNQPERDESEQKLDEEGVTIKTVNYRSVLDNNSYFVSFFQFTDPDVNERDPDYDVKAALDGGIHGMLNRLQGATLTSSTFTDFQGHQAMRYNVSLEDELIEGIMFMNGRYLYNVVIDYDPQSDPMPSLDKFLSGFAFVP